MKPLLSNEMLNSISFRNLEFVEPFSSISENSPTHKGKYVFLKEMHDTPGVLVFRYINSNGVVSYKFGASQTGLCEAVRKVYNRLSQRATNISFAVVPTKEKKLPSVLKTLKNEYFNTPVDNHFEILKPWITGERTDPFPEDTLTYRRPFMLHGDLYRFSMHDYKKRWGFYFIREKNIPENTITNVYLGKAEGTIGHRIRSKFYPNEHLYYQEIPGVLEYHISPIEVKKSMLPKGVPLNNKILEEYEGILIKLLNTRDNKYKRLRIKDEDKFKPFLKEDEGF